MKKRVLVTLLVLAALVTAFVGCSKNAVPVQSSTTTETASAPVVVEEKKVEPLTYAPGTVLRTATGYNSKKTGLSFDADTAGQGITLGGVTYHTGDLKPTWVEVEKKLGIKIEDKYQGNSATNEFKYWQERLNEVDLVSGNTVALNEYGAKGSLVNVAEYLDRMPNFKAYLEANPIVRLSITGDTNTGAIYFAPYFDGVNDIERMPLMRVDWVEKLLDGAGSFSAPKSGNLKAAQYQPYMPTSGKVSIETPTADGKSVMTLTKDYDKAGNIVATMNAALAKGTVTGVQAVNMLRDYIDKAYNGYYGTKRSNLFIGQDAAWDADELVALLRCVVANAYTLNGKDSIQGLFSREDNNLQRQVDLFRFAGHLFGVRGLESRQDYLYVDADGKLHDARQEVATFEAMERMHDLALEGLISESFIKSQAEKSETMLQNDLGFMSYDYNQTQTILNDTKLDTAAGERYMAVMVPVARWYDGTNANGVYMRFTESWRSVKTDAWAISKEGVGNDTNKLNAALALFDYAFSPEGQILLSYGPDVFIKHKTDGSYETFMFNGKEMPVIADETRALLKEKTNGNYTNFARWYLGSTLSFAKSQAFEYQCTNEIGKLGAGYISTAIGLGTVKHPELAIAKNKWYTSVPTVLPGSTVEADAINSYTELIQKFGNAKNQFSILVDQIQKGYTEVGVKDAASAAEKAKTEWSGAQYLQIRQRQWDRLVKFYEGL